METGERISRGIFGVLDMLPGIITVGKQLKFGEKMMNTLSSLKKSKGAADNVLDSTYFGDLMEPKDAIRYDNFWKKSNIGSEETWKQYQKLFPDSSIDDYFTLVREQSPWPVGYEPEEVVLHSGDRFNMVMYRKDAKLPNYIGGFGLVEEVPDASFVRNNLAIKVEWKKSPFVQTTFEVREGVELHVLKGPIGPQIDIPAGKVYPGDMNLTQYDLFGLYPKNINRAKYVVRIRELTRNIK